MAREPTNAPGHLRPAAPVAERVLLPGDPGRALRLAQALTDKPLMLNHHRGLWGYTGRAADGEALTVQATGLGGPSAAVVVSDLVALGARRLVRVGTCRALDGALALGDVVAADPVLAQDGTSRALGAGPELRPTLQAPGVARVGVVTSDLGDAGPDEGAAVDRTSAGVLAAAARLGVPCGVVLLVAADADGGRLEGDGLHAAELALGRAGAAALGLAPVPAA